MLSHQKHSCYVSSYPLFSFAVFCRNFFKGPVERVVAGGSPLGEASHRAMLSWEKLWSRFLTCVWMGWCWCRFGVLHPSIARIVFWCCCFSLRVFVKLDRYNRVSWLRGNLAGLLSIRNHAHCLSTPTLGLSYAMSLVWICWATFSTLAVGTRNTML